MSTFNIDGLTYTDKLPHSRIERILYQILKKQGSGGGGGDDVDLVVDDPSDVGNSLKILNNAITVDAVETLVVDSTKAVTSGAVEKELEKVDYIMSRI